MSDVLGKLRYRPGMRALVVAAPVGFEAALAGGGVLRAPARARAVDVVQAFFTRRRELERSVARLAARLGPRGLFWVCYPKAGALGTDLGRDVVREVARRAGLDTVAIVAVDEVWSAVRLMDQTRTRRAGIPRKRP